MNDAVSRIEPWSERVALKVRGFRGVRVMNATAIDIAALDSDTFNVIFALDQSQEDYIVEKFAGLYAMRGAGYRIRETGDPAASRELYINRIADKNHVARIDVPDLDALRASVDLVAYTRSVLIQRGLLSPL